MTPTPKRLLVTGAAGLLGKAVTRVFTANRNYDVQALSRKQLDITDPSEVARRFADLRPECIINCAAYTKVDDCEKNRETAYRVNAEGPRIIAEHAARLGARLFHISTDYVFDGSGKDPYPENSATGPEQRLSIYGRSKLQGEHRVASAHPQALIIRTAWLYGPDGPGFPDAILARALGGQSLQVVTDQKGAPTHAPDLASAIHGLAESQVTGILHVTNAGACTWYDFACEILRLANIDAPIAPVATAQFPRPAKRPANSVLDNSLYEKLTGAPMRSWKAALDDYMAARQAG